MKAIVYTQLGSPEVLQLKEVVKPTPKATEVLIRIAATTVAAEDPGTRASPGLNGILKPKKPILGFYLAGEIEAVGKDVKRFQKGDQVYGNTGLGLLGAYGDFIQNGETYDIIFDAVGKGSYAHCRGSLTECEVYLATVPTAAIVLQALWTSKVGHQKVKFATTGLRPASAKAKDLALSNELIERGKLKAVIDRCYPLEQIAEAHRYVETGRKKGNVVVTVEHNT